MCNSYGDLRHRQRPALADLHDPAAVRFEFGHGAAGYGPHQRRGFHRVVRARPPAGEHVRAHQLGFASVRAWAHGRFPAAVRAAVPISCPSR